MKFQDSSFNGLKVTVGTKSVKHPRTHPPKHACSKSNMPHQLFQSWGQKKKLGGGGSGGGGGQVAFGGEGRVRGGGSADM